MLCTVFELICDVALGHVVFGELECVGIVISETVYDMFHLVFCIVVITLACIYKKVISV